MARRQDLLEVVYANGMRRKVRKHGPIPTPLQQELYYRMNSHGHRVVDF
jgi:hypothetical protein